MGFSTLIDILGSTLIGGFVLLILLRLNGSTSENSFNYNEELVLQQNLSTVAQIVEHDFRKIGYCANPDAIKDVSKSIREADSTEIEFWTDVDRNGTVDSIKYVLGGENLKTNNPNDKHFYKIINTTDTVSFDLGITEFRLIYLDVDGDTLAYSGLDPGSINSMEINIAVEKTEAYGDKDKDHKYSGAFWRQIKLVARNLRNN